MDTNNGKMTLPEFTAAVKNKGLDNVQLIHELWKTSLPVKEKVLLSLEIYDLEPSYSVLTNMWLEYSCSNEANGDCNKLIFGKYQTELSDSSKNLEGTTEYSLYFDILEDPNRNRDAWNYFLSNNPSDRFIKIMLANSGPVPFDLKHELYQRLMTNNDFHLDIYKSIRHSCFDNCGQVDKEKAWIVFQKLDLSGKMGEVGKYDYYKEYPDVKDYLNSR